jgi:tetratricopeptide (TPR) repeat protein
MKRTFVLVAFALSITLASAFIVSSAIAAVDDRTWIGSTLSWGNDDYYGKAVNGYVEGSVATLWVKVRNDFGQPINVSEITVGFDWNTNYTNTLATRARLGNGEVRYFTLTFMVPNVTVASNVYLHGYTIYVKHVNSTGALVQTMTTGTTHTSNPDFAAYSRDQMDAREKARLNGQLNMPFGGFNSTAASILWSQAANETNLAKTFYDLGNFADARAHYAKALGLKNDAFTVERTTTGGVQDGELNLLNAQARSFDAQANYFNGLSNMWILIGVAAVLFAIGYILRGLGSIRKPAVATT